MELIQTLAAIDFSFIPAAGLQSAWETIRDNWLGYILFGLIAFGAIKFIMERAWMKLIAFIGIAMVVSVLVFQGDTFFGKGKGLSNVAKQAGESVSSFNVINSGNFLDQ